MELWSKTFSVKQKAKPLNGFNCLNGLINNYDAVVANGYEWLEEMVVVLFE